MKKIVLLVLFLLVSSFLLRPPVNGGKITSRFGPRNAHGRFFHTGTDIALPTGAPVNSTSWGTVTETGFTERNGNYVIISHLPVVESRYLHLDSMNVAEGQKVRPIDIIGTVGNTGISTGSHLHFEIRLFGTPLPPYFLCIPGRIAQKTGAYGIIDLLIGNMSIKTLIHCFSS